MKEFMDFFNNTFFTAMIIGYLLPSIAITKNENKKNDNKERYLERYYSAYITSCFIMERIAIYVYKFILLKYDDNFIIQSGIALTILLIITGMMIESFCNVIKVAKKEDRNKELELKYTKENDKVFIMGVVTLVLAIDAICLDYKVSLLCISLLLGKYFWIDSGLMSVKEICNKIRQDWLNVNNQVKKILSRFTYVFLIANFIGNFLYIKFSIASYLFSMFIALLLITKTSHTLNRLCTLKIQYFS